MTTTDAIFICWFNPFYIWSSMRLIGFREKNTRSLLIDYSEVKFFGWSLFSLLHISYLVPFILRHIFIRAEFRTYFSINLINSTKFMPRYKIWACKADTAFSNGRMKHHMILWLESHITIEYAIRISVHWSSTAVLRNM